MSGQTVTGQLYVDDPAIVFKGKRPEAMQGLDLLLSWWMALGIPLAWAKGAVYEGAVAHSWIGVVFTPQEDGSVLMELPVKFLAEFREQLVPFCRVEGGQPLKCAEQLVGRAGRIAYVVPAARPFVAGLYAALAASKRDIGRGKSRSQGRVVPVRRFASAAAWLRALVDGDTTALFPLQRKVFPGGPKRASTSSWTAQFDASTTGGGAVLRDGRRIVEYFAVQWQDEEVSLIGVHVADSKFQSSWELLTVLLVLLLWGDDFTDTELAIVGDSTSALQDALHLKGSGEMAAVAREIAWRQVRRGWSFGVGHLPAERNVIPDALSRLWDDPPLQLPEFALREATRRQAPHVGSVWRAVAFPK